MKQSDWMKGLLWAERFIEEGIFFEDDETGVESLNWEIFYNIKVNTESSEWILGASDYLDYYKEKLS